MIIAIQNGFTWARCSGSVSQDKLPLRRREIQMVVLPPFFFILAVNLAAAIYMLRNSRIHKYFKSILFTNRATDFVL